MGGYYSGTIHYDKQTHFIQIDHQNLILSIRATAIIESNFIEFSLKYYQITMLFLFKYPECSLMTRQGE